MTAPDFARLEALNAPTLARLEVQGEGFGQTCRAVCAGFSAFYSLSPAYTPALLALPSGVGLLLLPDWTDPEAHAFRVPSDLLPEVRRTLDLLPLLPSPEAQKKVTA